MAIGSDALLRLFDAAKIEGRLPARFRGRDAVADFVGGRQLDEGLELVVELLFSRLTIHQPANHGREPVKMSHAPSSTLAIANATRSQRCLCCSSCLFPAAVSL